jgi:hypothetical protein
MFMALALAASAHAAATTVRVCVNSGTSASTFVFARAEAITGRMFKSAGVALDWHTAANARCRGPRPERTVMLDFVTNRPASEHPGALAYAQPYEADRVVVLYDRVEASADGPTQISTLLAHVMTHEITHLLQGISRHSETGVMKAQWSAHDFLQMAYKPLPFAPEDIDLIQRGLRRLTASAEPVAPAASTDLH